MTRILRWSGNRFVLGLVVCLLGFVAVSSLVYQKVREDVYTQVLSDGSRELANLSSDVTQQFDNARRQALFLGNVPPVSGIVRAAANEGIDPRDGSGLSVWKSRLTDIFHAYLRAEPQARQVRYIGYEDGGRELVRVQRQQGQVSTIPGPSLQQKAGADYFQRIKAKSPDSTYISPIELNKEYGKVEFPTWPTYRAAYPVFDQAQQPFGFIIINFDASRLLSRLETSVEGSELLVMNQEKEFLKHPNEELEFARELGLTGGWSPAFGEAYRYSSTELQAADSPSLGSVQYVSRRIVVGGESGANWLYLVNVTRQALIDRLIVERFLIGQLALTVLFVIACAIIYSYHKAFREKNKRSALDVQYRAIFNNAKDAIVLFTDDGSVFNANPAAQRLLCVEPSEEAPASLYELFGEPDSEILDTIETFLDQRQELSFDVSLEQLGEQHDLAVTLINIGEAFAQKTVCVALMTDMTEIRKANALVKRHNEALQAEVERRTRDLRELLKKAESATVAKSRFLANMSHEIRTPMNGIFGMLSLIRREPLSQKQLKHLEMAETSVRSLTSLINDILDLSKIEAGRLQLESAAFDLGSLVHSCASSNSILLKDKPVTLLVDIVGIDRPWVEADANRIRQILNNFLSNAIKFTDSGEIRIEASTKRLSGTKVEFQCSVSDTGIGIDPERLGTLFQSFVQESAATSGKYGGTGLGLAICQQLCDLMGGRIDAYSVKGEGSRFQFSLPLRAHTNQSGQPVVQFERAEQVLVALHYPLLSELVSEVFATWGQKVDSLPPEKLERQLSAGLVPKATIVLLPDTLFSGLHAAFLSVANADRSIKYLLIRETLDAESPPLLPNDYPANVTHVDQPISSVSLLQGLSLLDADRFRVPEANNRHPVASPEPNWLKGYSLLVVDDHRVNREVLAGLLETSGADVFLAEDAYEAKVILNGSDQTHTIDLVLLDCQMPGMDGYELTRQIRAGQVGEASRDITIVAITAAAMSDERRRCFEVGMNDYLSKPVEPEALYQSLSHWLLDRRSNELSLVEEGVSKARSTLEPSERKKGASSAVWNKARALAQLGGSEDLLVKVIETYMETAPESLRAIQAAFEADDSEKLRKAAHSLKGASASLAAETVTALALSVEQRATKASLDGLEETLVSLVEAVDTVLDRFAQFLESDLRVSLSESEERKS